MMLVIAEAEILPENNAGKKNTKQNLATGPNNTNI